MPARYEFELVSGERIVRDGERVARVAGRRCPCCGMVAGAGFVVDELRLIPSEQLVSVTATVPVVSF